VTERLAGIRAITFDFGNTLVPVGRTALTRVVERTADAICGRWPDLDRTAFLVAWVEERERQFREEVPQFREVDLAERLVRVLARLRGMAPPGPDERWDQARAAERSGPDDVDWGIEQYSRAFVDGLPETSGVTSMLERLAKERDLAILSNWPLAVTIDRYAEGHGWLPYLKAIVVSQRVGTIKPDPAIFEAARSALGSPDPDSILHVGDDWAADIAGASSVGWRTAWLSTRPDGSPLPLSERDETIEPDLELTSIDELERSLGTPASRPAAAAPESRPATGSGAALGR
jgi:HAD superfamily hydrolase (TIGR01509 family)